jgi:hypothetical protein
MWTPLCNMSEEDMSSDVEADHRPKEVSEAFGYDLPDFEEEPALQSRINVRSVLLEL